MAAVAVVTVVMNTVLATTEVVAIQESAAVMIALLVIAKESALGRWEGVRFDDDGGPHAMHWCTGMSDPPLSCSASLAHVHINIITKQSQIYSCI